MRLLASLYESVYNLARGLQQMIVILRPLSGTLKANLERAKHEIERVLGFRGTVDGVKALNSSIEIEISINPKWDLPMSQKIELLKEWIPAKANLIFKVISVTAGECGLCV